MGRNILRAGGSWAILFVASAMWAACSDPDTTSPTTDSKDPKDAQADDAPSRAEDASPPTSSDAEASKNDAEAWADAGTSDGGDSGTAGPASPSGIAMPVGNLPGWKQIFVDDFLTDVALGSFPESVASKWDAYPEGWKDTSKNGTYSPHRVVTIHDGVLDKHLRTVDGARVVAALVPNLPGKDAKGGLRAGRFVVRFKADAIPRYKVAWLLWPTSETWPKDGEIDFPEGDLDGTISAFMHRQEGSSGGDQDAYSTSATFTSWHTAVLEWSPGRCAFYLDDKKIGESTKRVPNTSMRWVIQTETWLGAAAPAPETSGHVYLDWVAVYVPDGT